MVVSDSGAPVCPFMMEIPVPSAKPVTSPSIVNPSLTIGAAGDLLLSFLCLELIAIFPLVVVLDAGCAMQNTGSKKASTKKFFNVNFYFKLKVWGNSCKEINRSLSDFTRKGKLTNLIGTN